MKISYGITVKDESEELFELLQILKKNIDEEDEIIIVRDGMDVPVGALLNDHKESKNLRVYDKKFEGDFAEQKNFVIEKCTGDYIFHIDADEYPHKNLLNQLKDIIEANEGVEMIWVPRVNTVDGITDEHCSKWGWRITEKGWVNYPDYQSRIFKNDPNIRWANKVHERITGCKTYAHLPPNEELSLYHPKSIEKQEKQNALYESINIQKG
tara:strand:+ start:335 stop:967 length:633 start_codon:yes stop_codon:yes gene_type:complete